MNRKIIITIATTLALTLCMTAVAYGFTSASSSSITTGIITVTGTSTTTTYNGVADEIIVNCHLYRDDVLVGQSSQDKYNVPSLQTSASGTNALGLQNWECDGLHYINYGGTWTSVSSVATTSY